MVTHYNCKLPIYLHHFYILLTCICLRRRYFLKVAHHTIAHSAVTLTSRASVTLTLCARITWWGNCVYLALLHCRFICFLSAELFVVILLIQLSHRVLQVSLVTPLLLLLLIERTQNIYYISYFGCHKPLLSITAQPHSDTCNGVSVQSFLGGRCYNKNCTLVCFSYETCLYVISFLIHQIK
jgi:hypothetical protein